MAGADIDEDENPLIAALPPATDYMTYLTVLEYQLNEERLPLLHELLQDRKLTENIGWDLVLLLLPLLPASEECLQDVARLGNPREVILKATEALTILSQAGDEEDMEQSETQKDEEVGRGNTAGGEIGTGEASLQSQNEDSRPGAPEDLPKPVLKFKNLLSMLSVLHPRVKTQYPSRFLTTSLQAILPAYSSIVTPETTAAIVDFVKSLSGRKRPTLPPRVSSSQLLTKSSEPSAPDPEGNGETPSATEKDLVNRLLQSFLTHVVEDYVGSLAYEDDAAGFEWSARLQEKILPEKNIPGRKRIGEQFAKDESLHSRDATIGQFAVCSPLMLAKVA